MRPCYQVEGTCSNPTRSLQPKSSSPGFSNFEQCVLLYSWQITSDSCETKPLKPEAPFESYGPDTTAALVALCTTDSDITEPASVCSTLRSALQLLPRSLPVTFTNLYRDLTVKHEQSERSRRFGGAVKCLPWLQRVLQTHSARDEVRGLLLLCRQVLLLLASCISTLHRRLL